MVDNALDEALLLEVADGDTGQRAVDFETLDEDGLGDEAEGGDLLDDTVKGGLVEDDGVLGLVLDFALGPLLLLGRLALRRCRCFCLGLKRIAKSASAEREEAGGEGAGVGRRSWSRRRVRTICRPS